MQKNNTYIFGDDMYQIYKFVVERLRKDHGNDFIMVEKTDNLL